MVFLIVDVQWNLYLELPPGSTEKNYSWQDIDTTKYRFPSDIWIIRPTWEIIVKVMTILPVFVVGVLANSSLIRVILGNKLLRTTTNLFIANMAIADLGTCMLCPWMFLCVDFFQNYMLGSVGCRLDGLLLQALTLVAVFSLSAVSYDRVTSIVLQWSGKLTCRTVKILLVFTWIAGLVLAAPLALFRRYEERQWMDHLEMFCTEDTKILYSYWHVFVCFSVWVPLAIMAVCYSAILIKLGRYESQALKSKHPIVVRYKGRVARVLALVVLSFIMFRVPFTAMVLRRAQLLQKPAKLGQAESMYLL
ncbi:neuropeptide Y receptor type 2 isoform X2 [Orussus abietinus]|nr:neuropeptide Y receptor type 2 isoform X2 [Orussus abietinus]